MELYYFQTCYKISLICHQVYFVSECVQPLNHVVNKLSAGAWPRHPRLGGPG